MGVHQNFKISCIKGHIQQIEKATYWTGENISKSYI